MLDNQRVAVVVPAHDEEKLIAETIRSIPGFVDRVLVVDDASRDGTVAAVRGLGDPRVELIVHERNLGVGAAIITGYKRALEERIDVTAVMAADAQMDPSDLETLVAPVARREVDYAKANRLFTGQAWEVIPRYRYLGNAFLSLMTKIASGYWHVADSQSGYTAISLEMLGLLGLGLGIAEVVLRILGNHITAATVVLVALLLIFGSQFSLFAMWFDMESNKDLGGRGRRHTDR